MFGLAKLYCYSLYYLIALCLFHMYFKISAYNDCLVLLFSRNLARLVQELHSF